MTPVAERELMGAEPGGDVTARVTQIQDTIHGLTGFTYDPNGNVLTITDAKNQVTSYTYDNADRLIQLTQGASTVLIGYDAAGRRTSLTLPTGLVVTSGFDNASQLTSLSYQQGATLLGDLQYTYDSRGNRMRTGGSWGRTGLPPALASTIVNADNQMTKFGATTLTYDLNGNLTTGPTLSAPPPIRGMCGIA